MELISGAGYCDEHGFLLVTSLRTTRTVRTKGKSAAVASSAKACTARASTRP